MKLGIALGGGGAKGFAHLGLLRVLREAGIEFSVVSGTSIGALVGVVYASGGIEKLERYARNLSRTELAVKLGPGWPDTGIFKGDYIEELLRDFVPERKIEELSIPFAAHAVDIKTSDIITFKSGDLRTAVHASVSIPGIFKPVFFEDKILVDGGILVSVPVSAARELGADVVIAVDLLEDLSNSEDQQNGSWSIGDVLQRSSIIAQRCINHYRYAEDPPELLIAPRVSDVKVMDFHRGREIFERGVQAAEQALPEIQKLISKS